MDCMKSNCSASANDRMVCCWLCMGNYHLKCCGLKARDADAIADPNKSLQWICPICKPVNIEFYKFFKSFKSEYDQLITDFQSVLNKLSIFGELFAKFPNLDAFLNIQPNSSPKRKKTITEQSVTIANVPPNLSSVPKTASYSKDIPKQSVSQVNDPPILSSVPKIATYSEIISKTNLTPNNNISNTSSLPIASGPMTRHVSTNLQLLSNYDSTIIAPLVSNYESSGSSPMMVSSQNVNLMTAQPELRIIPPRKTIFATRFHGDTTVDEIKNYIFSKVPNIHLDINVFKINSRSRASFKIIVPYDYFEQFVDSDFWPKHTLVREFVYKEENLARIPTSASSNPPLTQNSKN